MSLEVFFSPLLLVKFLNGFGEAIQSHPRKKAIGRVLLRVLVSRPSLHGFVDIAVDARAVPLNADCVHRIRIAPSQNLNSSNGRSQLSLSVWFKERRQLLREIQHGGTSSLRIFSLRILLSETMNTPFSSWSNRIHCSRSSFNVFCPEFATAFSCSFFLSSKFGCLVGKV